MKSGNRTRLPRPPMNKRKPLFEQELPNSTNSAVYPVDPGATEQPQEVSLDQKVDRFFMQYEREATGVDGEFEQGQPLPTKPSIAVAEAIRRRNVGLMSVLFEQEDPTTPPPTDDAGGDMGGGDDMGGDAPTEEEDPPIPVPKINVNVFASRLARLVNNYDALLDPSVVILRRAQTYLAKNYSQKISKELMTVMELQYNMSIKTKAQRELDTPPAPMAIGAGMEGGGLGGGGGGGGEG